MNSCSVLLDQLDDPAGGVGGRPGDFDDAFEEEANPIFPTSAHPNPLKMVVVDLAVALEIQAQVEKRTGQHGDSLAGRSLPIFYFPSI
jgi:hypothetical protein